LKHFPEVLCAILTHLKSLPPIDSAIEKALGELFAITARLDITALLDLLVRMTSLECSSIVKLFERTIPAYWSVFSVKQCLQIRLSVSRGPVALLIAFDEAASEQFQNASDLTQLIELFPAAAARWFAKYPDESVRQRVLKQLSPSLIAQVMSSAAACSSNEVTVRTRRNSLECECQDGDDIFHLTIFVPVCYPLECPSFELSAVGRERFTRECRDEVARESLRPEGFVCAISTWRAKVPEVINHARPCPICLSLLDKDGEMPKAKCFTCQQYCHASCVRDYRSQFRKPKVQPRRSSRDA
jgi:hypothetical protein